MALGAGGCNRVVRARSVAIRIIVGGGRILNCGCKRAIKSFFVKYLYSTVCRVEKKFVCIAPIKNPLQLREMKKITQDMTMMIKGL